MQIKLDMKILVFVLIFYMTHQIKIYALLMIFACLHELSHLLMGLVLGIKPTVLEIKPVGFAVTLKNPIRDYNRKFFNGNILEFKKIFVYIMGPVCNIILAIIIYFTNIDFLLKQELMYTNLIIAFVNFLPVYPLDGGRIVKSILSIIFGLKKSYEITERVSLFVTVLTLAFGSIVVLKVQNYGLLIMLLYLLYINIVESKKIQKKIELYELINKEQ